MTVVERALRTAAASRAPGACASAAVSVALTAAVHVLGVCAFLYPFFLGDVERRGEAFAHAGVAPMLFACVSALLVAVAVSATRAGRLDAKQVALLGILAGLNAVVRLPGGFAGANLMFLLPILCGYTFGPSFGFMLGAVSLAASAAITGGMGPWVPFQMWALGWVGAGAGLLPHARGRRATLVLAAYAWAAGLAFGVLMNLWFWPFLAAASEISWAPGLGAAEGAARYIRFYLLTSFAWDSTRAIGNVILVVALGRPILRLLVRARARLFVRWTPAGSPSSRAGTIEA